MSELIFKKGSEESPWTADDVNQFMVGYHLEKFQYHGKELRKIRGGR